MNDATGAISFEQSVLNKLEAIERQLAALQADQGNAYPPGYVTPKEAGPYLRVASTKQVQSMCRNGVFKPGPELLDTSPPNSERPTYLIHLRNYFARLEKEQQAS